MREALACDPEALKDIIESSGVSHRTSGASFIFDCPRCGKKNKLYIRRTDGCFRCWVCASDGFAGRAEYALTELIGTSLADLRHKLYGEGAPQAVAQIQITLRDWFAENEDVDEDALAQQLDTVYWGPDHLPIDGKYAVKGLEYLESRGIDKAMALKYGIRYHPVQRRVCFPIESQGKLYGWQARAIYNDVGETEDGEPIEVIKALTFPTGIKKAQLLMFADNLIGCDHAIVCEGPVDALKADLCGGNVCTLGKGVSAEQIRLLRNSGVSKLYLALDPDAFAEVLRLCHEFSDMELYRLAPPRNGVAKDIGDMTKEAVLDLFRAAPRITSAHVFFGLDPVKALAKAFGRRGKPERRGWRGRGGAR